jgi:hypothetical protein
MSKKEKYQEELTSLVDEFIATGSAEQLKAYLASNSNLPGPRGNLELAQSFMDALESYAGQRAGGLWELCLAMADTPAQVAPVNDPQEFIPFCGTVGIGALGAVSPALFEKALAALKHLADDPRWRMREAVAMALQRLAASRGSETWQALQAWIGEGGLLEMRAAAAAVAEPALLKDEGLATLAVHMHQTILAQVLQTRERKSEAFRILRQALGYTVSVVTQAAPEPGFKLMAGLAVSPDPDLRWIVRENLKKNRLVKNYVEEVASIQQLLN